MKPKQSLTLPPDFKNPFAGNDPDEVWKQIQKAPVPLTREEEEQLRKGKITVEQVRNKRKNSGK